MHNLYDEKYARALRKKVPSSTKNLVNTYLPITQKDTVLEIGIGNGDFLPFLLSQTKQVYGIDINKYIVEKLNKTNIIYGSATDMPFTDSKFDKTLSIHTLEHIEDLHTVFSEIDRVTKRGGVKPAYISCTLDYKSRRSNF